MIIAMRYNKGIIIGTDIQREDNFAYNSKEIIKNKNFNITIETEETKENYLSFEKDLDNSDTTLFCTNDNIYIVDKDGQVRENNEYIILGYNILLPYHYLQSKVIDYNILSFDEAKEVIEKAILQKDKKVDNIHFLSTEERIIKIKFKK